MNELLTIQDYWKEIFLGAVSIFILWVIVFKVLMRIGKDKPNKVHPGKIVDLEEWEEKAFHDTKYKNN